MAAMATDCSASFAGGGYNWRNIDDYCILEREREESKREMIGLEK